MSRSVWCEVSVAEHCNRDVFFSRLRNFEQQIEKSTREYNMEKLQSLKMEVDEATKKFEECQDAYATSMYEFISKEQEYTDMIQQVG